MLRQFLRLVESSSIMIMVHYHKFILTLLEHLLKYLRIVNPIIVLNRSKLSRRLSISSHMIQPLFFTCFTMILSMPWSCRRWILIENLMLVDDLVVVMVINVRLLVLMAMAMIATWLFELWLIVIMRNLGFLFVSVFFFNHLWILGCGCVLLLFLKLFRLFNVLTLKTLLGFQ